MVVTVWICVISFWAYTNGNAPLLIDNLASEQDCKNIVAMLHVQAKDKADIRQATCIAVQKVMAH